MCHIERIRLPCFAAAGDGNAIVSPGFSQRYIPLPDAIHKIRRG